MKETKPDELFGGLAGAAGGSAKTDGRGVTGHLRAGPARPGLRAIIDEAEWQMQADPEALTEFIETLSALPNHYHRAMVTYLDHPECWKGATRFYHADTLPYWRKRKNMGHRPAAVDDESIRQLAAQIRHDFHRTEGRGNNCIVEPFRRGELDYFFAYPEDYSQ
ncbi:MAG: hypothetical protein U5K43_11790 [Halofilum sp. (in: g-proteobacteria)]|nr:hypothetical protein [Halofilum sp. (in: g-proteobacteria)]